MSDNIHFKAGYSDVNGIRMYYELYGQGSPLVLLHGGGSTIQSSFGRIIPQLAQANMVIAVELQNHGRSGFREVPETFEQDADDVATLLDNLNIAKADFLGFSNGGHTCIEMALRHPQKINKLILASVPTKREGFMPGFFEGFPGAVLSQMPQELHTAFLEVNPDPARLQIMFERDRDRMIAFRGWADDQIRSISVTTLLISGDADVISPEHAVEVHRLIPHSHLAILPGAHGCCLGEITTLRDAYKETDFVVPMILDFINGNEPFI